MSNEGVKKTEKRKRRQTRVLIVDADLDVHQVVRDILEINFKDVKIESALNTENFAAKVNDPSQQYDLILFNTSLDRDHEPPVLKEVMIKYPELAGRILLIADSPEDLKKPYLKSIPHVSRPFSLDNFGEVLKKISG